MEHVNALIVGAGLSGIGVACHLQKKNPNHSFVIVEGRASIGGTWDLFRYPGIRSDSDMFTYGYSFKPWIEDRDIATGESILRYLRETVDEHRLWDKIRFGHRVSKVSWSSKNQHWVADVVRVEDGTTVQIASDLLLTCTGYYNYERGYLPEFEGFDRYKGTVAHPQHWPEELDYTDKRILVIGSGATAVTVVPSMAGSAAHVTMLQRSPTYMFSRPAKDRLAHILRRWLPKQLAHRLMRLRNVFYQLSLYWLAKTRPTMVRRLLRRMAERGLGSSVDVDVHFNPKYNPWDERLCLIPDDDLYAVLKSGSASIVTDTIEHFTETGVVLSSGKVIEADVIVPATGLDLQFLGGIEMEVDGARIESGSLVIYKGMMFGNIPNWVTVHGYSAASWTLKADLVSDFVCRLLRYMNREGYAVVVPRMDRPPPTTLSLMANLASAGYIQRGAGDMPKQGTEAPWRNLDNYVRDYFTIKWGRIDDGVLSFAREASPDAAAQAASSNRPPRLGADTAA